MRLDDSGLHIRQSDIGRWMNCPDSLRRELRDQVQPGPAPRFESDAAFCGTVVHAVIESEVSEGIPLTWPQMRAMGAHLWTMGVAAFGADENTTFTRETFKSDADAISWIETLLFQWYGSTDRKRILFEMTDDVLAEFDFDVPFYETESGLQVFLTGQMDLVEVGRRVKDWKTSSDEYKQWEYQRWAHQPTVYTFAAYVLGLVPKNDRGQVQFEYTVFPRKRNGKPQHVKVWRNAEHWGWLAAQTVPLVRAVLQGYEEGFEQEWQMNDHHVLCSPKWCPFWGGCKGQVVTSDWAVTIKDR